MKDKNGVIVRVGDVVDVIDAVGWFVVYDINERSSSITYMGANNRLVESSDGLERYGFIKVIGSSFEREWKR